MRLDLGTNFRFDVAEEPINRLLPFEEDSLALVDFIEALFGGRPQGSELDRVFVFTGFEKAQRLAFELGIRLPSNRCGLHANFDRWTANRESLTECDTRHRAREWFFFRR